MNMFIQLNYWLINKIKIFMIIYYEDNVSLKKKKIWVHGMHTLYM
jgi:hypothetical protein